MHYKEVHNENPLLLYCDGTIITNVIFYQYILYMYSIYHYIQLTFYFSTFNFYSNNGMTVTRCPEISIWS